jgi:hypothetical protein
VQVDAPAAVVDGAGAEPPADVTTSRPPGRRWTRILPRVLVALVLALVVVAGWLAWRGTQVVATLNNTNAHLGEVRAALAEGEVGPIADVVPELQDAAARAHGATQDPVWRAAEHVPWLGRQLAAVSVTTDAFDDVATGALPPLVEAADGLTTDVLTPRDGRIDVAALRAAAPAVAQASRVADEAAERLADVDVEALLPALGDRVGQAGDQLTTLADRLEDADTMLATVPALLGADGPRTYLVLVLNPAELRSGGGVVGSLLELSADDGAVTLGTQRAARDLTQPVEPVLTLDAGERALHGDGPGRFVQSVTATPDFARSAELARALWELDTGRQVDGVVTVDPVVLAYLLRATGPVTVPGGIELGQGNVVDDLLSRAYVRYPDPDDSDAYFVAVAQAVTSAVLAGGYDGITLLAALRDVLGEGRISLWTDDTAVLDRLAAAGVAHEFLAEDGTASSTAGVFLNDRTVSKMDYYLTTDLTADSLTCEPDGTGAWLHLELASTAPADAATSLPVHVTGGGLNGVPAGEVATQVLLYAPRGGTLGEIRLQVDGAEPTRRGTNLQDQGGRPAGAIDVVLGPGQSATLDVHVRTAPGVASLAVERTPTLDATRTGPALVCGGTP